MNLIEIFTILAIHWFADFVLQTDKQAKGKSKEWIPLLSHVFNYSMVWLFLGIAFSGFLNSAYSSIVLFTLITFVLHTATDYITSRINSRLWAEGKVHKFFVSIGFDQLLHYIQLFTTYYLLTR